MFIGLPVRATPNQEMGRFYVEKRQNGGRSSQKALRVPSPLQWGRFLREEDGSFQVFYRTDLEVGLERTQTHCVALYLREMII